MWGSSRLESMICVGTESGEICVGTTVTRHLKVAGAGITIKIYS